MHALARRCAQAYLRDCAGYLGIAAATIPLGIAAQATGWGRNQAFALAASSIPPILATLLAAGQEAGPAAATPGKRRHGLNVIGQHGSSIGFGRALVRNTVMIGIPWQLGHTVAVGAAFGGFDNERDPVTVSAAILMYPLLAVMIASVALGDGRAIHDRVARTRVGSVP